MIDQNSQKTRPILLISTIFGLLCLLCGTIAIGIYLYRLHVIRRQSVIFREWIPANSTPGTLMTLDETRCRIVQGVTVIYYEITVVGLPPNRDFTLWSYDYSISNESALRSERSNEAGEIFIEQITVSNFVRGEPLNLAMVGNESDIQVYARDYPFPIEATGVDGCHVWVEIGNEKGTMFIVYGQGFELDEILDHTIVILGAQTHIETEDNIQVDNNGAFTEAMFPQIFRENSGTVTETFTGQKCDVMVEYEWGLSALEVE